MEPDFQGKGYGKALVDFPIRAYAGQCIRCYRWVLGTALHHPVLRELRAFAGIIWSRTFFTDHYDHPIYECGVKLVDMVSG